MENYIHGAQIGLYFNLHNIICFRHYLIDRHAISDARGWS